MVFYFAGAVGFWGPAAALSLPVLLLCVLKAPWRQLWARGERLNLWLAAIVALALFWQLQVSVRGLLGLHPLLLMALTMVFGAALAILAATLALLAGCWFFSGAWLALPPQCLLNIILPAGAAVCVLWAIDRVPQRNLFVYMLGGGFFGAMLTVQVMALASLAYVWLLGPGPLLVQVVDYYYLTLLMMFPEGFINGAVITVLTVLKPELVKTYDDRAYLDQ
ncbi:MAG: hypothetical protein GYB33_17015 [Gammaproteobacteria bacterium]|nr:hypothetical protein [Gammaproteobacteria bacterium]